MGKHKETKRAIRQLVIEQLKEVNYRFTLFKNNPYFPENIHKFRVSIRHLRAVLNFLKPTLEEEAYNLLNDSFKELAKRLGAAREADVLVDEINRIAEENPELIENYADVFRYLYKERLQLTKDISTKKALASFEETLETTSYALADLELTYDDKKWDDFEEIILNRFESKKKKVEKQYRKLDEEHYEEIHEVRKDAKKVRYATESFRAFLPKNERKQTINKMKKIQEKLGEKTDYSVNINLLNHLKENVNNESLEASISAIIQHIEAAETI